MSMTAKDFKAIANIIFNNSDICPQDSDCEFDSFKYIEYKDCINDLCEYFKTTNAKFDRDKFIKACGVTE